jgi:SUMO ligase MMS21 Smc5/6 complex component
MTKKTLSLITALFFIAILFAPAIFDLTKSETYTSIILELNEEEENKSEKSIKDFEVKFHQHSTNQSFFFLEKKKQSIRYYFRNYPSIFRKLILPPPELT